MSRSMPMLSFDPSTMCQFAAAFACRFGQLAAALIGSFTEFAAALACDVGPLATTFAGDISPFATALTCGVGQLGSMFTHCFRQLSTTLAGLLARLRDHGCALFGGGAGQLAAAFGAHVQTVGDPVGQLGIEH